MSILPKWMKKLKNILKDVSKANQSNKSIEEIEFLLDMFEYQGNFLVDSEKIRG